jgi:hypothetical protein
MSDKLQILKAEKMNAEFKTVLNESEIVDIENYCRSVDYFALEQSLGFAEILYKSKVNYFLLWDEGRILSFCQIYENFRVAHIWYGPVCNDRESVIITIDEIIRHYKQRGYWYLGIQMNLKTGPDCDFIEYQLNKRHRIKYIFDNNNTKASLELDLSQTKEDLLRGFRKGHRSDVKKAISSGISVEEGDEDTVRAFSRIYRRMCDVRSIKGHTSSEVVRVVEYLKSRKQGVLLVAKTSDGAVLGGAIFVYQGVSVRYLLSASDPDIRELPITHLVIYKAIETARETGFRYFDFWGYNHFAEKNDQIYKINSFKKGFGGYDTFFAKKMNINLIPGGYNIYRLFVVMKKLWGKFPIRSGTIL